MLSALLALAAGAGAVPSSVGKSSPLGGSLTGIFQVDDYPADALDLNQQGSVGVLVRVDPKGGVSDCMITSSSGSPALDAQTCRIVWLRAKFTPARDATGRPTASTYQQSIVWRIAEEDEGESSEPYMVRWIVSDWDNAVPSCRTEVGGAAEGDHAGPAMCPAYVAGIPASLGDLVRGYAQLSVEQRFSIGSLPSTTPASGDRLIGRELARLDVDAAGRVTSCRLLEVTGIVPDQLSRACVVTAKHFAPKKDARGAPAPFTAFYLTQLSGQVATAP